jgi:hypothetical protein
LVYLGFSLVFLLASESSCGISVFSAVQDSDQQSGPFTSLSIFTGYVGFNDWMGQSLPRVGLILSLDTIANVILQSVTMSLSKFSLIM